MSNNSLLISNKLDNGKTSNREKYIKLNCMCCESQGVVSEMIMDTYDIGPVCKNCAVFLEPEKPVQNAFDEFQQKLFQEAEVKKKNIQDQQKKEKEKELDRAFILASQVEKFAKSILHCLNTLQKKRDEHNTRVERIIKENHGQIWWRRYSLPQILPEFYNFFDEDETELCCRCNQKLNISNACIAKRHEYQGIKSLLICNTKECNNYAKCLTCSSYNIKISQEEKDEYDQNGLNFTQKACFYYIMWRGERVYCVCHAPIDITFSGVKINKDKVFIWWILVKQKGIAKDTVKNHILNHIKKPWILDEDSI